MELLGPAIERNPAFPEGVNVHAAQELSPDRALIRTWERGAGLTFA
jgi:diaminopimelate epimerase